MRAFLKRQTATHEPARVRPQLRHSETESWIGRQSIPSAQHCPCGGGCPNCEQTHVETRVQTKLNISTPGDRYEQEADRVAETVMRMSEPAINSSFPASPEIQRLTAPSHPPPRLSRALPSTRAGPETEDEEPTEITSNGVLARQATQELPEQNHDLERAAAAIVNAKGTGKPLSVASRAFFEPRFGHDLSSVRIHEDGAAAVRLHARAFTHGTDIWLGSSERESDRSLLAHELTHVIQQSAPQPNRVAADEGPSATSSVQKPGAARILTGTVQPHGHLAAATVQRVPATNLSGYPDAERRAVRQSTIPATMIDSAYLLTVFGTAAQNQGVTTREVFGGTTVFDPVIPATLQRGLESTGAHLVNSTNVLPLGTTQTLVLDLTPFQGPNAMFRFTHLNHTENRVTTAVLLIENVGAAPAAIAGVTVPTAPFMVRTQTFIAGSGWNSQRFGRLMSVLAALPDTVLAEAAGTTFTLAGQGTADEAGRYVADTNTIEMHLNAFPVSPTTFGSADMGMRNIAHEVGHLLDLRRLERAWQTFNSGGQTPAGRRNFLAERSLSGTRWSAGQGGNYEQVDVRRTTTGNDFRQAATRDGISPGATATDPLTGGPTSYSNTDWQELFAESFSLYVTDPRLFALIRPNLFAYFSSRFPLPTAPATAPPPTTGGNP